MSFLKRLFGGSKTQSPPKPTVAQISRHTTNVEVEGMLSRYGLKADAREVSQITSRLNRTDADTELLNASIYGEVDRATRAIKAGANVNCVDEYGSTPLDIAKTMGKHDYVAFLIKNGARS